MNQTLTHLATLFGMKNHVSIPYSKEENGIVERANKEVNRHIRNIVADKDCVHDWPTLLCILLNSSVKQPLGASPNTLLFGNALPTEPGVIVDDFEQLPSSSGPRTIRDYVDKLLDRQSRLLNAAF
jgi:hypothetical protein